MTLQFNSLSMGRSSVLCIFCVLFVAINVCTQDMSYSDAIKKYVTDCAKNTPTDGRMTVSYFTKDALFKTMDSVYVKQFDTKKQLRRYSPSEVLMQAACICTEVAMNSYEIIVSPMITQENKVDALTLCAFHDRSTDLGAVMDFPINFLNSWLHAQFWAQMPRTLFAPVGSIPAVSCIGNDGHPTVSSALWERFYSNCNFIATCSWPNACYYVNYAKFEMSEENEMKVDHKVYYGPFLGSQVPNYAELAQHLGSKTFTPDFATVFDFVKCSMLKTKTRLTAGIIETGCKFRAYLEDWSKLVVVQCCCDGHDDPNCAEVTSAVKEKKILCFDGTLTPNARFYFAKECHYTVTKHYKRIFPKNSHEKMKKSKLYHLYTSNIGQVEYDVSFAFLVEKNVESSCYEKTHQFDRDYYVINCATRSCDRSFQSGFVDLLDEKALSEAVLKAQVPHCENGSISIVAEDAALDKLPHLPNTTPVVGQFCMTRLKMGLHGSNKVIDINFGPIHRIDQDCNTHFVKADGEFQYKCCYEASSDLLHIEPNCHYSTILSVINSPDNDEEVKNEDEAIPDPTEADQIPTRQTVFENVDKCEQSNTGQLGKLSRRCQPGGHGCFHQKGLTDANEAVIASCIGGAEKLIAAHQNAFDRFHEALICLVEEAQNQCHVVESGTRREFLCCCGATVIRNHVASCVVDSNMLFNTKEYAVKYVGEFKDVD